MRPEVLDPHDVEGAIADAVGSPVNPVAVR